MRGLATSDWHADWSTCGVDRFPEIRRAALQTVDAAISEKVDGYFFLGDLSDPEDGLAQIRALDLAMEVVERLVSAGIPSYWLMGNHDAVHVGDGYSTLSPMMRLQQAWSRRGNKVIVFEHLGLYDEGDFTILSLPHPYRGESDRSESTKQAAGRVDHIGKKGSPCVVIGHLTIPGVQPGEEVTEMPKGAPELFPFEAIAAIREPKIVLNGHYHRRQEHVTEHGYSIHIPGAIARLTFAEEDHDPAFLLFEV